MSLPLRMGTLPPAPALTKMATLLAVAALAACGGGNSNVASHSASPSSTAVPSAPPSGSSATPPIQGLTGSYGVLVSSQSSSSYTVSVIGIDGKVTASADASTPHTVSCASVAGALVPPPVSTSDTRAYFMDAQGAIRFLAPNGDSGQATRVPVSTASARSMFAVSANDQKIAVVVATFTAKGSTTRLYVEDLNGGGHHVNLFTQSGATTLWPIGWRGSTALVLAKVNSCTQGGGPFCCSPIELHVVDPATATRRFTVGSNACHVAGAATPAGVVCIDTASVSKASLVDWLGISRRSVTTVGPELAYVSPNGGLIALVDNNGTTIAETNVNMAGLFACTWMDDIHVLSGGDPQHQPRIGNVTNGSMVPVAAQGDCAGRLPGGL